MEISQQLQLDLQKCRNELYSAIYNHQIWHNKHLENPENQEFIAKRDAFAVYTRSVAARQKEVHCRLRQELEKNKGVTPDEVKDYIASIISNTNSKNTTAANAPANEEMSGADAEIVSNGIANDNLDIGKEDYEDNVCNGDIATDGSESLEKARSVSVETVSADDTEVLEVPVEAKERPNKRKWSEEPEDKPKTAGEKKMEYFNYLGLTTPKNAEDIARRCLERKRRSNKPKPQFLYSEWEANTKRKRHCYLQSAGNVPQTRQTTARLKEPSPPSIPDEAANVLVPLKSASPTPSPSPPPTSKALSKSLVPTQKATTRPNILRNMSESRVFPNKSLAKTGNENGQVAATCTTTKTSQSMTHSKTVHIPGLPSGLTIERIENDSAVCINCRNPGILTNCDNCEANYHVSCHSLSPPPPRLCPKCASKTIEPAAMIKRNEELAAASYAAGVVGKAGEDPEIDKTSRGFYKIGTNSKHQIVGASSCINKLSGSTFLIPIVPNTLATSISLPKSTGNITGFDESRLNVIEPDNDCQRGGDNEAPGGGLPYTTTILVNNHLSRSTVTYVPQPDHRTNHTGYPYKISIFNESKKLLETHEEARIKNDRPFGSVPTGFLDERKESVPSIPIVGIAGKQQQQQLEKLTGRVAESLTRGWKKSSKRAVPGLTRIVQSGDKRDAVAFVDGNKHNVDQLQKFSYNGRVRVGSRQSNNRRYSRASDDRAGSRETDHYSSDGNGKVDQLLQDTGEPQTQIEGSLSFENFWPQYGSEKHDDQNVHSLFSGHNESDYFADCVDLSKYTEGTTTLGRKISHVAGRNDKKCSRNRKTLADRSKRFKNLAPTEHVKLEEAHLPAPSGAKLMRNTLENDCDSSAYPLHPNRRRTTEERILELHENGKMERRPMPRILKRNERKSLDSQSSPSVEPASRRKSQPLPISLEGYDFSLARLPPEKTKLAEENESPNSSDTSATEEASSPARVSDLDTKIVEKKTPENQELERNEAEENDDDEETDDNEEDVEDEEDQDCPIVDEEIREQATIEGLRISTVSPESMQVLQQFESAMMNAEHVDKTANL